MTILLSPRPGPSPRCTFQSHFPRTNVGKLSLECRLNRKGWRRCTLGPSSNPSFPFLVCSRRDRRDIAAFSPSSRHRPLWPCGRTRLKKEEEEEGDPRIEEEEEEADGRRGHRGEEGRGKELDY